MNQTNQKPDAEKKKRSRTILVMVFVPMAVMLGVFFIPEMLREREEKRVLKVGVEADAVIVHLEDTGNRHNSNPEVEIHLDVKPQGKKAYRATVRRILSPVEMPNYQPGTEARVKYDPDKPQSVALIGLKQKR